MALNRITYATTTYAAEFIGPSRSMLAKQILTGGFWAKHKKFGHQKAQIECLKVGLGTVGNSSQTERALADYDSEAIDITFSLACR